MIRVTIEKLPFGEEAGKETLHTLIIANDGTGTPYTGNYNVRLQSKGKEDVTAYVRGHYRRDGVLKLLRLALEADSSIAIGQERSHD